MNDKYSFNSKVESIHFFPGGDYTTGKYDGTDAQIFLIRRVNPFQSLALGYQVGFSDEGLDPHRTIQQFALSFRGGSYRIAHRFRTDQTFGGDNPLQLRLRYRLSVELPLQGQSTDPGEFYLVGSDELILANRANTNSLENRLGGSVGILLNQSGQRLQTGFEFQSRYRDGELSSTLWLKVALLIRI